MVLLNTRLSAEELAVQVEDASLDFLLVSEQFIDKIDAAQHHTYQQFLIISLEEIYEDSYEGSSFIESKDAFPGHQVIGILYTSGTTGNPKGVMQTYGNHYASATASIINLGFHKEDIWLAITPLYHISGLSIVMRGFIYGMTIHLFSQFDAE